MSALSVVHPKDIPVGSVGVSVVDPSARYEMRYNGLLFCYASERQAEILRGEPGWVAIDRLARATTPTTKRDKDE